MTDEDLEHAASVLCRCQHLEPDALVMHRMKTMEAWESRVPFVKAVLAALAENLPDAMVEAATKAILFEDCGNTTDWQENLSLGKAALTAALNVKEG